MASNHQNKYNKLQGKRVVIFGGTSGIGFSVAEGALEHGALVTISGSNQSRIDKTIRQLQSSYPDYATNITGHVVDLFDINNLEPKLHEMLRSITSNGSNPIDHIAFTAGDTLPLQPLSEFNPTTAPQAANVRLFAPMLLGKVAPNYMSKSEAGNSTITLTSGSNTKKPAPGWAIIAAWGSAIEGLARGLAVDLAPSLRVNCVAPGAIRTPLLEKAPENVLQAFREKSLVQDTGSPEDTAEAYLYCMKDRFVTGQVVLTDGGRTLV